MYREHFRLKERPFTHAPGERFFNANAAVDDAIGRLRHLLTARDSIAVVTGGPGVGKSALAEHAFAALGGRARVARVDLRYGEAEDICAAILLSLGEAAAGPRPIHALHALRETMASFAQEQQCLVLALDIGGITADVARHLLRVMNLAGEQRCQLNLMLMGPHPLHQQLDIPALIQLRQRIAFRYRVRPLTLAETERYLRHQLEAVGGEAAAIVSSNVAAAVYCYVAGVPRLINTLLDTTLSEACLQGLQRPDGNVVRRSAEGLGWKPMMPAQSGSDSRPAPPSRPAPARSSPPRVAIVTTPPPERRDALRQAGAATDQDNSTPASEATMQLRAQPAAALATGTPATAGEPKSPASAARSGAPGDAGMPAMDPGDAGATGMLRLQDLDERFAESIFGNEK